MLRIGRVGRVVGAPPRRGTDGPLGLPREQRHKVGGAEGRLPQLLAAAAMVDRELSAARAPAAPAAPGPEAEACAGGGGGWEEAVFRAWAKSHVVRLGLCPWAEAAMPTARRAPRPPRRAPEAQRKRSRQHARPGALRILGAAAAATAARGRR